MHKYSGRLISVTFEELPALEPKLLVTRSAYLLVRWWKACKRRRFRLVKQWSVDIVCHKDRHRLKKLEGTIVIPASNDYLYDGASVPLPWIVTCATFGVLRPLGIMLTASIVHDYAFRTGGLLLEEPDGQPPKIKSITRCDADFLFREMISTVNGMPIWAFWAWSAVRLGWLSVKYNNRRWAGKAPSAHLLGVVVVLVVALQRACP